MGSWTLGRTYKEGRLIGVRLSRWDGGKWFEFELPNGTTYIALEEDLDRKRKHGKK